MGELKLKFRSGKPTKKSLREVLGGLNLRNWWLSQKRNEIAVCFQNNDQIHPFINYLIEQKIEFDLEPHKPEEMRTGIIKFK